MSRDEWQDIVEPAEHLIDMLPQYVEPDSPYLALARASEELGRHDEAVDALERFWQQGGYEPASLKRLGAWLEEAGRTGEAIKVYQSVNMVDPLDQELHGALGDLLLDRDRASEALREFSVALELNPHDLATAYFRLAKAHHALGNSEETKRQLLLALDVAPNYRPAQRLLLELMGADTGT